MSSGIQAGTMFYFAPVQYMTTRKSARAVGVEKASTVEPPGPDWELVSVCLDMDEFFYFWKRNTLQATIVAGCIENTAG